MAQDDSLEQRGDPSWSDAPGPDTGPISIATTDPAITAAVAHPSGSKLHPDETASVETTQAHESNPVYAVGVRTVVIQDRTSGESVRDDNPRRSEGGREPDQGRGPAQSRETEHGSRGPRAGPSRHEGDQAKEHASSDEHAGQNQGHQRGRKDHDRARDNDDRERKPRPSAQPSMMKTLLTTAGIALVGGLIGAVGYSYMFGSKSDKSSSGQSGKSTSSGAKGSSSSKDGSSSKAGSHSKNSDTEKGSGGQEDKESGSGLTFQSSNKTPSARFASADELSLLKTQIMDSMERLGRLSARLDRISRLKDNVPTILETLQIEMAETARKIADLAAVPATVRDQDKKLGNLQAELNLLRSQFEARSTERSQTPTTTSAMPVPEGGSTRGMVQEHATVSFAPRKNSLSRSERRHSSRSQWSYPRDASSEPCPTRFVAEL